MKSPTKLCPFRKVTRAYTTNPQNERKFVTGMQHAEWTEEEFLPCIGNKCASYCMEEIGSIYPTFIHTCSALNNNRLL